MQVVKQCSAIANKVTTIHGLSSVSEDFDSFQESVHKPPTRTAMKRPASSSITEIASARLELW